MASPINSTTSAPVTHGKASAKSDAQGSAKLTEEAVAETQATGDRVNLSSTAVQLSSEPSEGAIKTADEAAQVAATVKEQISNNPAQAIAAQSGS